MKILFLFFGSAILKLFPEQNNKALRKFAADYSRSVRVLLEDQFPRTADSDRLDFWDDIEDDISNMYAVIIASGSMWKAYRYSQKYLTEQSKMRFYDDNGVKINVK